MKLTMPITKKSIKNHFAYAWWQYALLLGFAIFGWNLLFTTTHYRSPANLKVEWYCDSHVLEAEKDIDGLMTELHESLFPDMEEINFIPVVLDDTYGAMQLTVWISAGEGDVFLLNKDSFSSMAGSGGMIELEPYIEDGTLDVEGLDLKNGYVVDAETGKSHLAGIPAEQLTKLQEYGIYSTNEVFGLSATGGNIDNAVKLLNWLIHNMK
ncbi:MAG: hypothetical protein PHI98_14645 [Eubacteriales bacterium]|nr:hypothetical protein [Eubacteriales bacterium]